MTLLLMIRKFKRLSFPKVNTVVFNVKEPLLGCSNVYMFEIPKLPEGYFEYILNVYIGRQFGSLL